MSDLLDLFGKLRYGRSTAEKEAIAAKRALPGAPYDPSADQEIANRYASGYLFAENYPRLAPAVMPVVNMARTGWFGDSPEVQSYANAGMNRALMDAELKKKRSREAQLAGIIAE